MRTLWTLFGLLALATVIALALRSGGDDPVDTPAAPTGGGMVPRDELVAARGPASPSMEEVIEERLAAASATDEAARVADDATDADDAAPAAADDLAPGPSEPAAAPPEWFPGAPSGADDAFTSSLPPGAAAGAPDGPVVVGGPGSPGHEGHQPQVAARGVLPPPERVEDLPEPAPLVGSGTEADPYVVSWDDLAIVRRTYRAEEGQRVVPPHVGRLDGAWVTIGGYYLAPWGSGPIGEMVLMRFMWDGCCIGVPPTAYTAIEARLAAPADRARLLNARMGRLTGRLTVDPYEERGWLLALYLMDDARFEAGGG